MANKDQKLFRSHLGGFNRKDVNKYIREADMSHSAQLEEINARLGEVMSKLRDTEAEAVSVREEKDSLMKNVSLLAEKSEKLTAEKAELTEENASLKEIISSLQTELESVKGSAHTETTPDTADTLFKKIYQIPGAVQNRSAQSSPELESAKAQAQHIISATERECEAKLAECDAAVAKIRTQTEEQAQYIRDRLSKTAGSFLSNVSSDLSESIESCIREINSCVNDMESEIKCLLVKMSTRSDEMNERISFYQNYLSDGIEDTMNRIDTQSDTERKDG